MAGKIKPEDKEWQETSELLNHAIAILISVNMNQEQIQTIISAITQ